MGSCCGRPFLYLKMKVRSNCMSACCKSVIEETDVDNTHQSQRNVFPEDSQDLIDLRSLFEERIDPNYYIFERAVENENENRMMTKRQKRKLRKRKNKRKNRSNRRRRYVNRMKRQPRRQPQKVKKPTFRQKFCKCFS